MTVCNKIFFYYSSISFYKIIIIIIIYIYRIFYTRIIEPRSYLFSRSLIVYAYFMGSDYVYFLNLSLNKLFRLSSFSNIFHLFLFFQLIFLSIILFGKYSLYFIFFITIFYFHFRLFNLHFENHFHHIGYYVQNHQIYLVPNLSI